MMNWIVTSGFVGVEPCYFVKDKVTGERKGTFDCEPWAQEYANSLNVMDAKKVIRDDPGGDVALRLRAIEIAEKRLGPGMTTGDLHRWADQ